jgi:hypothetical protein
MWPLKSRQRLLLIRRLRKRRGGSVTEEEPLTFALPKLVLCRVAEVKLLRVVTALGRHSSRVKTDTFGSNRYQRNSRSRESLLRRQIDESRQGTTSVSTIRIDNQWSVSRFSEVASLNHRTGTTPKNHVRARRQSLLQAATVFPPLNKEPPDEKSPSSVDAWLKRRNRAEQRVERKRVLRYARWSRPRAKLWLFGRLLRTRMRLCR